MIVARLLYLIPMLGIPSIAVDKLDPIHVDGTRLLDSSGRTVILRGVTTIVMNNDGKPMVMRGADFDRIRSWGYNIQQIRLGACPLALLPPCNKPDPDYLVKLESWVTMAEERGIYTILKATTYDVAGLGFQAQFRRGAWDKFWDTGSGFQDQFIAGWKVVWEHFKGRTSVIGYDILNETNPGSNTPHFNHDHLFPFYRKAQLALQSVDTAKLMVFQPSLRSDDEVEALGGINALFAPHFYPTTNDPDGMWRDLVSNGEKVKAPLLIGEYGLPNTAFLTIKAATPTRDQADAALFDHASLGIIKTWYTSVGNWALLMPDGSEQPRMQIFVRPYPQRTAGIPGGFSFKFRDSRVDVQMDAG